MAGGTQVTDDITMLLEAVAGDLEELPYLARLPQEIAQVHAVCNEWDYWRVMCRELYDHYRAGRMTAEQRAAFLEVVRLIPSYEPHMRALGLAPPDIPVGQILAEAGVK